MFSGYGPDGTKRYVTKAGFRTKAEAQRALTEARRR